MSGHRSRDELVERLGVTVEFIRLLEEEELVVVAGDGYPPDIIERIRVCWGLHADLGVNVAGLEIILDLLERLENERRMLRSILGSSTIIDVEP